MQVREHSTRWLGLALLAALAGLLATSGTLPAQIIPGRYIAVLKKETRDTPGTAKALAAQHGLQLDYVYTRAIKGFAFGGSEQAAAALARRAEVAYVEPDQIYTACQQIVPTGIRRCDADAVPGLIAGGGLMVDVDVAVIDTGLDGTHPDLNVVPEGIRFYDSKKGVRSDANWQDDNGHGTHVGGIIGALDNDLGVVGVAPGARLWPIKVLDDHGQGTLTAIIAGVDWVAQRADTFEVANMSLAGRFSQAMNDAVRAGTAAGIVFVVSSHIDYYGPGDAADSSPGSEPTALTVSALIDNDGLPGGLGGFVTGEWLDDEESSFSASGQLVDVCAPGHDIYSTYLMSLGGYRSLWGNSMATAHASGAAALYIARHGLTRTAAGVEAVCAAIRDSGWQAGHYAHLGDWIYYEPGENPYLEPVLNVSRLLYWETPATLSFTTPADASKVTGVTPVQVTTTVPGATAVQFYLDGQLIGEDTDNSDGWALAWDTTTAPDGLYTLVAVATDGSAQLAGDALLVGVNNGLSVGPSVKLIDQLVVIYFDEVMLATGVTNLRASAVDLGLVSSVDFYFGETLIGSGMPQGNGIWSLAWDTTGGADGTDTLAAVATGADGSQGVSLPVSVAVQNHAIHVGNLDRASAASGGKWTASVTVTIHDTLHQPAGGATVYATWTTGPSSPPQTVSAVTDANGQCVFVQEFSKKYYVARLAVEDITPPPGSPGSHYSAAFNHDPDGDSDGTSITVGPP